MIAGWLTAAALALSACAAPVTTPPTAMAAAASPPYHRDAFGDGWRKVNRWCDTRDQILARDLTATTTSHGCNVLSGTLRDPYTGRVVVGSTRALDVDHVAALEWLWVHGAWAWAQAKREAVANDPLNLLATTAKANRSKGSRGLDQWMPAVNRCDYAHRFDAVADKYGIADGGRNAQVARACR